MGKVVWCFISLVSLTALLGCSRSSCNVVPSITGSGGRSFLLGEYPELRVPNGVVVSDHGGVAGLIVVNLGGGEFIAYDRYSTVQGGCPVEVEEGNLTAIDPCTRARYVLKNGSPVDIAKCSLRPYFASRRDGGEAVYVHY